MKVPPIPHVVNNQVIIDSVVGLANRLLDSSTIYMQSKNAQIVKFLKN